MSKTKSVLVIEDDPDGQELLSRMLFRANIAVELTSTGEDALQIISTDEHAAAIIDLALPGIDGFEVLKKIRSNDNIKDLHCIAVTAFHTPTLRQRVMQAGFNSYFAKPIDDRRLLSALQDMLSEQDDTD